MPIAAEVPMAWRMGTLCHIMKGTESVPPPIPTRLEIKPMQSPTVLVRRSFGIWRAAFGVLPCIICEVT